MPRSRNIKPAFFLNDDLGELNPIDRLLFIGLWTIADYKGELEWRPARIKAQILPYDSCDIEKIAINLDKKRFVSFYSDGVNNYLKINKFEKHQNPHPNEKKKGSDIPSYSDEMRLKVDIKGVITNHDKSRLVSDKSVSDNADSCFPDPDTCSPKPDTQDSGDKKKSPQRKKRFVKPEHDEVLNYFIERDVEPTLARQKTEEFFAYYDSVDWHVGRNRMKDWKGAVRTWVAKLNGNKALIKQSGETLQQFHERAKKTADRARQYLSDDGET